jgi:hypothetical protein
MEAHSRQTTEIVAPGELARRLMVRFDTPSPGGRKRELIAWLEDAGLDAQVLAHARADQHRRPAEGAQGRAAARLSSNRGHRLTCL